MGVHDYPSANDHGNLYRGQKRIALLTDIFWLWPADKSAALVNSFRGRHAPGRCNDGRFEQDSASQEDSHNIGRDDISGSS